MTQLARLYLLDKYEQYVHVLSYNATHSAQRAPVSLSRVVGVTSISVRNNTLYLTGRRMSGVLARDLISGKETLLLSELGVLRYRV